MEGGRLANLLGMEGKGIDELGTNVANLQAEVK